MNPKVKLSAIYSHSADIVARVIEDELIIVPLVSGIGDMEDDLFTLNETGRAIWDRLDGQKNLKELVALLSEEFDSSPDELEDDVIGFVQALLERKMLVES